MTRRQNQIEGCPSARVRIEFEARVEGVNPQKADQNQVKNMNLRMLMALTVMSAVAVLKVSGQIYNPMPSPQPVQKKTVPPLAPFNSQVVPVQPEPPAVPPGRVLPPGQPVLPGPIVPPGPTSPPGVPVLPGQPRQPFNPQPGFTNQPPAIPPQPMVPFQPPATRNHPPAAPMLLRTQTNSAS